MLLVVIGAGTILSSSDAYAQRIEESQPHAEAEPIPSATPTEIQEAAESRA